MNIFRGYKEVRVLIRGAGDIATGIAYRLFKSGFTVIMTELPDPLCIRRKVAFCEAVCRGSVVVEGVEAVLARDPAEALHIVGRGCIPVLVDPYMECIEYIQPLVLVDATLTKKNQGIKRDMAPIVIGVGPGFEAGVDCHAVIETMRGHHLGRVITGGKAMENTGIPGEIAGFTRERVIYAPGTGKIKLVKDIGDRVQQGEVIGLIGSREVNAPISGVIRGMISDGSPVAEGMKIGDVDPRGIREYCFTISDKARAIGGGVLEAILYFMSKQGDK